MDKKRFQLHKDSEWWFVQDNTIQVNEYGYRDDLTGEDKYRGLKQDLTEQETVDLLNEQESTITSLKERNKQLRRRLEKINGGYGHLARRNGLTANEWVIESQEKELIKKNEQISDWIERHSKDIVKIGEQQTTIRELKEEMVRLHKIIEQSKRYEDGLWVRFTRLEKENEQLRQEVERLKKELDEKCP